MRSPAMAPRHSFEHGRRPMLETWARQASPAKMNAAAGAAGGFMAGLVTCPLDTIKIRLQAQEAYVPSTLSHGQHSCNQRFYKGTFGTARTILRQEGLRGLYRGGGLIVLGYLPTWAVWFATYERSKNVLQNTFGQRAQPNAPAHAGHKPGLTMSQIVPYSSTSAPQSSRE